MNIAYGTCVGSWDRFHRYVEPRTRGRQLTVQVGQPSISVAYNRILDQFRGEAAPDALILIHEDLELIDPDTEAKVLAALEDPDVAFVGVAGGRGVSSLAWWEAPERFGHQLTDSGPLELGPRTGEVDSLEGSFLALSPWAIDNLRYDESLTGFHCCDSIVILATRLGRKAVVADIDTHHHTAVGVFKSEAARREWFANDEIYRRTWNL